MTPFRLRRVLVLNRAVADVAAVERRRVAVVAAEAVAIGAADVVTEGQRMTTSRRLAMRASGRGWRRNRLQSATDCLPPEEDT